LACLLTFEAGTDRLSRNVGITNYQSTLRSISELQRSQSAGISVGNPAILWLNTLIRSSRID